MLHTFSPTESQVVFVILEIVLLGSGVAHDKLLSI